MTENSKPRNQNASRDAPSIPLTASKDATLSDSINAPSNSSKGKTVSSKITAND